MKKVKLISIILWVIVGYAVLLFIKSRYPTGSIPKIKLGIDVLKERGFDILKNKNIGILTNQAGIDSKGELTWTILKNTPDVHLKTIFAPVHGLEGKFMSLETFYNDEIDDIPIYSVFASNSRPKDEWLRGLDAMVIDLQGLGLRYYNYWAFMVYMMAACFENNIEVVVLDRPNPLGGCYVGGPLMDPENTSAWGPIPGMPLFHGMTIGELANYCKNLPDGIWAHKLTETGVPHSGLIVTPETLAKGKLTVIPMKGWKRSMLWQDTGLEWIETSPYIGNLQSAYEYVFTALSSFVSLSCYDTCNFLKFEPSWDARRPLRVFSSRHVPAMTIIRYLENEIFKKQKQGFSLSVVGKHHNFVEITVKDIRKIPPGLFGLAMLALSQKYTRFYTDNGENVQLVAAHIGDEELVEKLTKPASINVDYFKDKWANEALQFIEKVRPYYLYE
ncbi:MAG: DUF1343 domain-containing protein [Puniceicoccales bacterium]|jgi:uncharacterized protein YbbC (DUF1343 family)|nr:DUF1343 domain-containing protein [Puniceicoccales bacterium]